MGVTPWLTQGAAARPGLPRSLAEVEGIHLYHCIFEPKSHRQRPSMDRIQNKMMMPVPKELTIHLSVQEVTATGLSLPARDLGVYSELPQHFH